MRRAEDFVHLSRFEHFARAHHDHAVGDFGDDPHVVRDEEDAHAGFFLKRADEREDFGLHRHVERRCGLVGDEKRGAGRQGHRDHHALAHAAREHVGITLGAERRVGDPHPLEERDGFGADALGVLQTVLAERLGDLFAHRHDGIERTHGFLEDHRRVAPANGPARLLRRATHVDDGALFGSEKNFARFDFSAFGLEKPHDGERSDGFARARFTHEGDGLSGTDGQGNVSDGGCRARESDLKVLEIQ